MSRSNSGSNPPPPHTSNTTQPPNIDDNMADFINKEVNRQTAAVAGRLEAHRRENQPSSFNVNLGDDTSDQATAGQSSGGNARRPAATPGALAQPATGEGARAPAQQEGAEEQDIKYLDLEHVQEHWKRQFRNMAAADGRLSVIEVQKALDAVQEEKNEGPAKAVAGYSMDAFLGQVVTEIPRLSVPHLTEIVGQRMRRSDEFQRRGFNEGLDTTIEKLQAARASSRAAGSNVPAREGGEVGGGGQEGIGGILQLGDMAEDPPIAPPHEPWYPETRPVEPPAPGGSRRSIRFGGRSTLASSNRTQDGTSTALNNANSTPIFPTPTSGDLEGSISTQPGKQGPRPPARQAASKKRQRELDMADNDARMIALQDEWLAFYEVNLDANDLPGHVLRQLRRNALGPASTNTAGPSAAVATGGSGEVDEQRVSGKEKRGPVKGVNNKPGAGSDAGEAATGSSSGNEVDDNLPVATGKRLRRAASQILPGQYTAASKLPKKDNNVRTNAAAGPARATPPSGLRHEVTFSDNDDDDDDDDDDEPAVPKQARRRKTVSFADEVDEDEEDVSKKSGAKKKSSVAQEPKKTRPTTSGKTLPELLLKNAGAFSHGGNARTATNAAGEGGLRLSLGPSRVPAPVSERDDAQEQDPAEAEDGEDTAPGDYEESQSPKKKRKTAEK